MEPFFIKELIIVILFILILGYCIGIGIKESINNETHDRDLYCSSCGKPMDTHGGKKHRCLICQHYFESD